MKLPSVMWCASSLMDETCKNHLSHLCPILSMGTSSKKWQCSHLQAERQTHKVMQLSTLMHITAFTSFPLDGFFLLYTKHLDLL